MPSRSEHGASTIPGDAEARGPRTRRRLGAATGLALLVALLSVLPMLLGSDAASAGTPVAGAPGAPTIANAVAGDASATVSWTPPVSQGDSPIEGYDVSAILCNPTCGTSAWSSAQVGPSATSAVVGQLVNGDTYVLTVDAFNASGTGSESAQSNPVTPTGPPTAPGFQWPPDYVENGAIGLAWLSPLNDGGSPVTGYTVYVYPGTDCAANLCSGSPSFTVPLAARSSGVIVDGLTNGDAYGFTVTASNALGEGPPSAAIVATPEAAPGAPDAPTDVVATAGTESATVSWTAPVTNGSPVTNYVLYVYPASQCTTVCQGAYVAYFWTGPSSTSYTAPLADGTPYVVTVTATSAAGLSPVSVSNVVTPLAPSPPPTTSGGSQSGGGPPSSVSSTTIAVASTPSEQTTPPASVSLVRISPVRGGTVVVVLACLHQRCSGVLQLARVARGSVRVSTKKDTPGTLAPVAIGRYSLKAGERRGITLHLTMEANSLLTAAPGRKLSLVLRASVLDGHTLRRAVVLHAG